MADPGLLTLIQDYWLYFLVGQYPQGPWGGLALTVALASLALLLSFPLGLLLALARVSPWRALRWPVAAFITVLRGTPLLMVIFWAYFLMPSLTGHKTDQFTTMVAALVIFDSVYLAEIIRSGIAGLPQGQSDSARSLGMTPAQVMAYVVLPQALRNMVPSFINQFVSTIKETSLGYIISLAEVSFVASQINAQVLTQPVAVYGLLALTYFVMCFSLSRAALWVDRRLSRHRAGDRG